MQDNLAMQPSEVQKFENHLGQSLGDGAFSLATIMMLDEQEAFPYHACRLLDDYDFPRYYVPASLGGQLNHYQDLLMMLRLIARRDLTIAIAHAKTYLGAAPVWVAGSESQCQLLADAILSKDVVSLALTEKCNGGDLLGSKTQTIKQDNSYTLSGEKWLINNATRSRYLSVFAKNPAEDGSRGFSLFLFDKQKNQDAYVCTAKIKTLGVRGADISGIQFKNAQLDKHDLIGEEGCGLEIIQKSMQMSRTLCSALSLGAMDTALRTTLKFAENRILYGKSILNIPHVRKTLIDAYVELQIADIVALTATRCINQLTEQMSLISAIVKYYIPVQSEKTINELAIILGARHYLREEHDNGIFQKLMRDNRLVGLFDGSTIVNLQLLTHQLLQFSKKKSGKYLGKSAYLFVADMPLDDFDVKKLRLSNHGYNDILHGIDSICAELCRADTYPVIASQVKTLIQLRDNFYDDVVRHKKELIEFSHKTHALCETFCRLNVAAICVSYWFYNHGNAKSALLSETLIERMMTKLINGLPVQVTADVDENDQIVFDEMMDRFHLHQLFSRIQVSLGKGF